MSTNIEGIQLDSEESQLWSLFQAIPPGHPLTDIEISDRLSWWVSEVFRVSASLLGKGLPICFSSWTGWCDPATPDDRVTFWHSRDPRDLDDMSRRIRQESEGLQEMLKGCEAARQTAATESGVVVRRHIGLPLYVLYAVGLDDTGNEQAIAFLREGRRHEPYEGVRGWSPGNGTSKLLDQCFELSELTTMINFLAQDDCHSWQPLIPVAVFSVADARQQIELSESNQELFKIDPPPDKFAKKTWPQCRAQLLWLHASGCADQIAGGVRIYPPQVPLQSPQRYIPQNCVLGCWRRVVQRLIGKPDGSDHLVFSTQPGIHTNSSLDIETSYACTGGASGSASINGSLARAVTIPRLPTTRAMHQRRDLCDPVPQPGFSCELLKSRDQGDQQFELCLLRTRRSRVPGSVSIPASTCEPGQSSRASRD